MLKVGLLSIALKERLQPHIISPYINGSLAKTAEKDSSQSDKGR